MDEINGHYFDRVGRPISLRQWAELRGSDRWGYSRLGDTSLVTKGGLPVWVSTVWMGIDHSFWGGPPLIFETMAFADGNMSADLDMDRYVSEYEAFRGHDEIVGRLAQDWWLDLGGRA